MFFVTDSGSSAEATPDVAAAEAVVDMVEGHSVHHDVARISPGEPLHLVDADSRRVLDWDAASRGRMLAGNGNLLPDIPATTVRVVVSRHLRE